MQDNKETMATFHCVTRIEITRFKADTGLNIGLRP